MDVSDRRRRHPDHARSKFERWVLEQGGTASVGKLLGVHQITVVKWLSRSATPSLALCVRILEEAGNELTLKNILEDTKR